MSRKMKRMFLSQMLALGSGTALLFSGCDPTLRADVENGVINVSQSFLTALIQAIAGAYTTPSTG